LKKQAKQLFLYFYFSAMLRRGAYLISAILCLNCILLNAQNRTADSLRLVIKNATDDTTLIKSRHNLGEVLGIFRIGYWDTLGRDCQNILDRASDKKISVAEKKILRRLYALSLNNIGFIYQSNANYPKALEYLNKSLLLSEKIGDREGIAQCLSNIAGIHQYQGDLESAIEVVKKSLKLNEEEGREKGIANSYSNLGYLYRKSGNYVRSFENLKKALQIQEKINDRCGMATTLNNIGFFYQTGGDPAVTGSKENSIKAGREKALGFYARSIECSKDCGSKKVMASALNNCGAIYLLQKKYALALKYCRQSYELSRSLGFPEEIRNSCNQMYAYYKVAGDHKLALEYYELAIKMRDSISNETNRKASIRSQLKYEYEKQAAADSVAHAKESEIKSAELSRQSAEIKVKKNQQYALFGGLFLVILFSIFMYNRFKVTQKQKVLIERQKEMVEEQKKIVDEHQKEIMDSIYYAKRIQMAQIPSDKRVHLILKRMRGPEVK
jgi:tetratricopeptide (TPR) repeat protein